MGLMDRLHRHEPPPPQPIDRDQLLAEMAQDDPAVTHVRDVHHDAQQVIGALSIADGISIRREREWWSKQRPPKDGQTNGEQKPC